jgi:hypothetical protein
MPERLPTAAELARQLADALERANLPYAVGGAIALAYYAPPRATVDVDLNVFVPPTGALSRVIDVLTEAGFQPDDSLPALQHRAETDGQFRGRAHGLRVDVFVPAFGFYAELESRRRLVKLGERPIWILSAEDIVVLKMMFYRRKDLADVEAVLRDQGDKLDRPAIRQKLAELVGANDERLRELEAIEQDVDEGQE